MARPMPKPQYIAAEQSTDYAHHAARRSQAEARTGFSISTLPFSHRGETLNLVLWNQEASCGIPFVAARSHRQCGRWPTATRRVTRSATS